MASNIKDIIKFTYGAPHHSARVIQVIETTLKLAGDGTENSPLRTVTQYWTLDGRLITEIDPLSLNCRPVNE